jgi:hypothetical protein
MSPQQFAVLPALCGALVLVAGLGSPSIENTGAPIEYSLATSVTARATRVDAPAANATASEATVATSHLKLPDPGPLPPPAAPPVRIASLSAPDPVQNEAKEAARSVEAADIGSGGAAVPDPRPMRRPALPVLFAAVSPSDPLQNDAKPAVRSFESLDACPEPDVCIDQYLWSLYERTPKIDTVKVPERIKVTVKKKGKTRTVMKTVTKYVTQDFGWKDPIAAQKVGMSLKDYVIGGMDRSFKRKLYHALRAMDEAGLSPGITSAFRCDYRQGIATGNKAATDSSYHGGSRRGGYGHGLAADLVSVKGETRAERWKSTEVLWKWIDANEKELGIGRPYLDRDPPHVAPIDGREYTVKRGLAKVKLAGSAANKRPRSAVRDNHGTTKRAPKTKSLKVGSL